MKPPPPKRRIALRLPEYDYSQPGAYFVTLVTYKRAHLFGDISAGDMRLNRFGEIVHSTWLDLPRHYPHVELDAFVIMPNHVHAVLMLQDHGGRGVSLQAKNGVQTSNLSGHSTLQDITKTHPGGPGKVSHALPEIIRAFKSFSAVKINILRRAKGQPVWQRNYYDHVIRNQDDLEQIRKYVEGNPLLWEQDPEYR